MNMFRVDVEGVERENFDRAVALLLNQTERPVGPLQEAITDKWGRMVFWSQPSPHDPWPREIVLLPVSRPVDAFMDSLWRWVQKTSPAEKRPTGDKSEGTRYRRGWRVHNHDFGRVALWSMLFLAVKPAWIEYRP